MSSIKHNTPALNAEAWWRERGGVVPPRNSNAYEEMYTAWCLQAGREAIRTVLRPGLRIKLVRGWYDGEKKPENYRHNGLWIAGTVEIGATGTVQRAPPELVPGIRNKDGNPDYWPWCVVWDDPKYKPKEGYYYSLAGNADDSVLCDKFEVIS